LNNINAKKLDLEFAVDPLFRKTSASFDNYGARSLLLINLGVQNGCEIIFDSSDHVDVGDHAKKHSKKMINVLQLKEMLGQLCDNVSNLEICPKYANFKFAEESKCLDKLELESEDEVEYARSDINSNDLANMDIQLEEKTLAQDLDAAIFPIIVGDLSQAVPWHDHGMAHDDDYGDDGGVELPHMPQNIAKAVQMVEGSNGNSEYTYFNSKLLDKWAGPNHWKYQKNAEISVSGNDNILADGNAENMNETEKKSKKKKDTKRKAQFLIDFQTPSKKKKEEIEKLLEPVPKSLITLSTAQLNNQLKASTNLLLPPDTKFSPRSFTSLFNKPNATILPWSARQQLLLEKPAERPGNEWAEFGEEQDHSEDGFVGAQDDFAQIQQPYESENVNFNELDMPIGGDGLTLIAEPERDQRITVAYATKANFVDVKALKGNLWNEICRDNDGKVKKSLPVPEKSFKKVMETTNSRIPANLKEHVSVPYYFICLLHLANENNLEIIQTNDGDLNIHQPVLSSPLK
jgi:condensin complex subunit 2